MSWLTEIAGKAEGLLNQIDQSAATVLHKPNSRTSPSKQTYSMHGEHSTVITEVPRPGTSAGVDYSPKREHR